MTIELANQEKTGQTSAEFEASRAIEPVITTKLAELEGFAKSDKKETKKVADKPKRPRIIRNNPNSSKTNGKGDSKEKFNAFALDNFGRPIQDEELEITLEQMEKTTKEKQKNKTDETKTVEETPVFDDSIIFRALNLGIPREAVNRFENTESLNLFLTSMEKRLAPAGKPQVEETKKEPVVQLQDQGFKWEPYKASPDVDLEFATELEKQDAHYARQFYVLQQHFQKQLNDAIEGKVGKDVAEIRQSTESDRMAHTIERFDALLQSKSFPAEYRDYVGDEDTFDLDPETPVFKNRGKLVMDMQAMAAVYRNAGQKIPSEKELLKKSLIANFGDKAKVKILSQKANERATQFTKLPANREKEINPTEIAAEAIRQHPYYQQRYGNR